MRLDLLVRPSLWSFAVQRVCTWAPLRRVLASGVAALRPAWRPTQPAGAPDRTARLRAELQRDGVAFLPAFLSPDTVGRIKAHLEGQPLKERFAPGRSGFTVDDVPANVHVAEYATAHLLRSPDIVAIANHPELLAAAAAYLGCKPTISSLSVWWSLPADGSAQEAENYHRDVDEWRFVKLFVYLSDVDEDAGPHCFVRGSHRHPGFLRIRRIPDPEVEAAFKPEDQLKIQGRTGDAFLEDTFGLHKGQPPRKRRRLLLQVQYSINPIAVYRYAPIPPSTTDQQIDPYVNRLYLQSQ